MKTLAANRAKQIFCCKYRIHYLCFKIHISRRNMSEPVPQQNFTENSLCTYLFFIYYPLTSGQKSIHSQDFGWTIFHNQDFCDHKNLYNPMISYHKNVWSHDLISWQSMIPWSHIIKIHDPIKNVWSYDPMIKFSMIPWSWFVRFDDQEP